MKTNSEREEFAALRRLLVLKRYEQPPPPYFDWFAAQVAARVRQEQIKAAARISPTPFEIPWLQRLWALLEARVFPMALGAGVCGLIMLGVSRAEKATTGPTDIVGMPQSAPYPSEYETAETKLLEPASFHSSTSGVFSEQPSAGIIPEILGPKSLAGKEAWGFEL